MGRLQQLLFGKKKGLKKSELNTLDLFVPVFSGKYDPELNSTYVSICNAHARHLSKIKPKAYLKDEPAKSKEYITRLLTLQPNPIMTASKMWEMVARDYFMTNTAILFLEWDYENYKEPLKAIWPLDPDKNSLDVAVGPQEKVFISFRLEGEKFITDMDNVILLTRNNKPGDLFGRSSKAVDNVLKVLQTNYEGVEQAIKTSAFIRFLVQSTTPLTEEVKKEKAKYFAETYLGKDSSGVAYIDGAQQVTQVDSKGKYVNADEMREFKNEIYEYLGANEKILQVNYNENEWQSYYESVLEPFIIQLEDELTVKIFTQGEISAGNRIRIHDNRLNTASMKTRTQIAAMYMKLPVIIPNVVADLLYLPRSEHGDKEYSTLNYVETEKQNLYQGVVEDTDPDNEEEDEDGQEQDQE